VLNRSPFYTQRPAVFFAMKSATTIRKVEGDSMTKKTNWAASVLVWIGLAMNLGGLSVLHAQDDDQFGEDSKLNTNLGMTVTAPANQTAQFMSIGWGVVAGAGYNFNNRHAIVGEFMWNRVYASDAALRPLRQAVQPNNLNGDGNLFSLTANYRYELRGKSVGIYFIGGGGWYHRNASLSKEIITGHNVTCLPAWLWWGFSCTSGSVTSDQTVASFAVSSFGANAGVGFTAKVGEPRYRFYVEARYNYAPTRNIKTQFIPITAGIRF
jgi:hypothetical protein